MPGFEIMTAHGSATFFIDNQTPLVKFSEGNSPEVIRESLMVTAGPLRSTAIIKTQATLELKHPNFGSRVRGRIEVDKELAKFKQRGLDVSERQFLEFFYNHPKYKIDFVIQNVGGMPLVMDAQGNVEIVPTEDGSDPWMTDSPDDPKMYTCRACDREIDKRGWEGHATSEAHLLNIADKQSLLAQVTASEEVINANV